MNETSQTASCRRERELGERARVRPLQDGDPRIAAQARMELSVADVDRDDARGAAVEEDVGEAARRRADVDAVEACGVDAEPVEAVRELLSPARDVARRLFNDELRALVDLVPRLVVALNAPRDDERLRLRPRLREAALDEEDVEALLHVRRQT